MWWICFQTYKMNPLFISKSDLFPLLLPLHQVLFQKSCKALISLVSITPKLAMTSGIPAFFAISLAASTSLKIAFVFLASGATYVNWSNNPKSSDHQKRSGRNPKTAFGTPCTSAISIHPNSRRAVLLCLPCLYSGTQTRFFMHVYQQG